MSNFSILKSLNRPASDFSQAEIATLLKKASPPAGNYECAECGAFCGPEETWQDFASWRECEHCDKCSKRIFREEQSELRGLRSLGY